MEKVSSDRKLFISVKTGFNRNSRMDVVCNGQLSVNSKGDESNGHLCPYMDKSLIQGSYVQTAMKS